MPLWLLIGLGVIGLAAVVCIVGPVGPTTRTAWIITVAAPFAILVPPIFSYAFAFILFGLIVVDAIAARGQTAASRKVSAILPRGVPVELAADASPPPASRALLRQPSTADLAVNPSIDSAPLAASITGIRRGRHTLPELVMRITGPLGLASWRRLGVPSAEILVFPDVIAAERIVARVRRNRFSDPSRIRRGPLGLGTEFEAVRDYQPDDDIRQVNWRATARVAKPMSNQFRIEQDRDVIAVVDCGRLLAAPIGNLTRLDVTLDAVAALVRSADVVGDRAGFLAFDDQVRREVTPRRDAGERVVRASFDLEPRLTDSDYELAFRIVSRRKRAFVCVFTDLVEERAARPLLDAMPWLIRKHRVVIASIADPELSATLTIPPRGVRDSYLASAALDVLEARSLVVANLQRSGAQVIEAPIATFSESVVAAYLDAKRRNRI
ncbi:MAG: DUF58 domain-containing protein [Acidimicrobiia bacterium]